jgi:RHS repeat-associated protein
VRAARRQRALAVLLGLLGLVLVAGSTPLPRGGVRETSLSSSPPDTTVVFGPGQFTCGSPTWTVKDTSFDLSNYDVSRRYEFRITNGDPDGTHRVAQVSLCLNDQELMNAADVTSTVAYAVKTAEPLESNELTVGVKKGSSGSHIRLDLVTWPDQSSYRIYGPSTHTRASTPLGWQEFDGEFAKSDSAKGPYTLILTNGDPDGTHRVTGGILGLNGDEVISSSEFGSGTARLTRRVALDSLNDYSLSLAGSAGAYARVEVTATDSTPPRLTLLRPAADTLIVDSSRVTISGSVSDETPGTVQVNSLPAHATSDSVTAYFADSLALPSDGTYSVTVQAANAAGFTTTVTRTVIRDTQAPTLDVADAPSPTTDSQWIVTGSWSDLTCTRVEIDGDPVAVGTSGTFTDTLDLDLGPNGIFIRATDALGHVRSFKRRVLRNALNEPAARDSAVARSELPATEIYAFLDRVSFLYSGDNPQQTDVTTSAIEPDLAAVIRGRATSRDFGALPNVTVKVLGHDEYGQTITREDGQFDLVVNGGGPLLLRFLKSGYLEAQRAITVPVNDYTVLSDVALIGRSTRSYTVDPETSSVAVFGRFESDSNGDRNLLLHFAPATVCTVTVANGATTTYAQFHVRLKEFTVGGDGEESMPGQLPPTTAYTYCMDMSVAEADDALPLGAARPRVTFSKPIVTYVRNFLHMPVGTVVPSGSYDPQTGQWVASEDGRVVQVRAKVGGRATLDIDGDGQADGEASLAALGIDSTETTQVANCFATGETLWRVRVTHFTDWDFNYNEAQVMNAGTPVAAAAEQPTDLTDDPTCTQGCVIENENRVLGESIPIVGTPFSLNYRSNRVPGDQAMRSLRIPLIGETLPQGLRKVHVTVDVAGRRYSYERTPAINDVLPFNEWDGQDVYGRPVQGSVAATIRIGYEIEQLYSVSTAAIGGGGFANGAATSGASRSAVGDRDIGRIRWTTQKVSLGAPSTAAAGLGGWTISPHHIYDTNGRGTLYRGDGSVQLSNRQFPIVKVWAGTGYPSSQSFQDSLDVPPMGTTFPRSPMDMVADPGGSVYFTDNGQKTVGRISRDGKYYRVAGTGTFTGGLPVDGASAKSVKLCSPQGIALGPDGSVYFVDGVAVDGRQASSQVFRVDAAGTLHLVAGQQHGTCLVPDTLIQDTLAVAARLCSPYRIAVGPDGSVFIKANACVLRVGTNGRVRVYAGLKDRYGAKPEGEAKADSVPLDSGIGDLACDAQGNLYISEASWNRIRRVSPDGLISTYIDNVNAPSALAVGPDGALYFSHRPGGDLYTVYRRAVDGSLSRVAGGVLASGCSFLGEDGKFAIGAHLCSGISLAVGADGTLFVGEQNSGGGSSNGIYRIAPELLGRSGTEIMVPSKDGTEINYFTPTGRHLRTEDARTGVVLYALHYAGGQLSAIVDANGDSTTIVRNGTTTYITAPYGQVTTLTTDAAGGFLKTVTNAAQEQYVLDYYGSDGLLRSFQDPERHTWIYTYDGTGRLETDTDPTNHVTAFGLAEAGVTREVTRTDGSRITKYVVQRMLDGLKRRFLHGPQNTTASSVDSVAESAPYGEVIVSKGPAQEQTVIRPARDPRFGWLAPVDSVETTTLPSPRIRTITRTRATSGTQRLESYALQTPVGPSRTVVAFDTGSRRLTVSSQVGRTATAWLDPAGRPDSLVIAARTPITFGYDARGKLTHLAQGGRARQYTYDLRGRIETARDTLGFETTYHCDDADRDTQVVLPGGRSISFGYDAVGNVTHVQPPGRPAHEFQYTTMGQLQSYVPPSLPDVPDPATTYTYNGHGELTDVLRPDSQAVHLNWSTTAGLLESIEHPRGTELLEYTSASSGAQLHSVRSADGVTVTYGYDGPLLTSETWSGPVSGAVIRSLDMTLRDSALTVSAGGTSRSVPYSYDADGLLIGAGDLAIARRSSDGLVDSTTLSSVTSRQDYDGYGDLANLHYTWPGGSFQQSLHRDALGRIDSLREVAFGRNVVNGYRYDDAGRLYGVTENGDTTALFWYDANGNRLGIRSATDSTRAHYDPQDRLDSLWVMDTDPRLVTYNYTPAGELREKVDGPGSTSFAYDVLGSLRGAVLEADGDSIEYVVDGLGRRVGRKLYGAWTHRWLYDGPLRVAAELSNTGGLVATYVYGTRGHVPDYVVRGDTTYRLITDQLGSVRAVVRASDGALMERIDYDAWGNVTRDTVNAGFVSLGYAGGLRDPATELVRFGARDYDPSIGRWTCKDPIGFADGHANAYSYVGDEPANLIDPEGTSGRDPWGAVRDWWKTHGPDVAAARRTARDAVGDASKLPGRVNGPGDAYRHIRWMQRTRCEVNLSTAILAGVAHEVSNESTWPPQPLDELIMDLMNNYKGLSTKSPVGRKEFWMLPPSRWRE